MSKPLNVLISKEGENMKYALIQGNEDGRSVNYLEESEIENINQLMEDYGIDKWVEKYDDPNYWKDTEAMLVKIQVCNPIPKKVVNTWEIEKN